MNSRCQADLSVHGGPYKAVYGYPSEHYPYWRQQLPQPDLPLGAFGENLTTEGLFEDSLHIGDQLRIGTALLQVTQPRVPCYKITDASQSIRDKHRDDFETVRKLEGDEAREKGQELMKTVGEETKKAMADILTPEQNKRFKEIQLQQEGARAFNEADVQKALSLTDDQKEKIKTINDDAAKEMRLKPGERVAALVKSTEVMILRV